MQNKKIIPISCIMYFHVKDAYPMIGESVPDDASLLPFEVPMAPEDDENGQMKMNKLSQLGFRMLPDRRIRFGGKTLQGVTLPKSSSSQISIIKRLLTRYGPCLETNQERGYQLNEDCFAKRENEFLKLLAKNLSNLRFKYIL
jgi:hypothetical protein